ncbi:MAG: FecR domain-containing protein [Lachnospiraceae bacterium]|nr:FecR domain-containing protein [Lachnospiraceae bacterium]
METKNKGGKTLIIVGIILALVVIGVIVALLSIRGSKLKATTMRLLRRVNVVTLEDEKGNAKAMTDNMKLQNGNALSTEADSMVSVGLDDYKVVTVEENSRAEFYQQGKQLELALTKGSLFVDVSQHLADDESFDVRTATMSAGIRGTTIYFMENPDGTWSLYLISGKLHVRGHNPVTNEEKETDVVGGYKLTAYTFDDREVDSIVFVIEEFSEEDMPLQLLQELALNEDALARAELETGYDAELILELANGNVSIVEPSETETVETETETETETESIDEGEGEGEDGENPEEENLEEIEEEEEQTTDRNTVDQNEDVSDDDDNDTDLTDEESEATEEIDDGFKLSDYVDYIDENGVYHLKDGTLFDPAFYREMYGEILEENGYISDEDLLRHYLEYGKDEKRFANQEDYDAFTEEYLREKRAREEEERKAREEAEEQQAEEDVASQASVELETFVPLSYELTFYYQTASPDADEMLANGQNFVSEGDTGTVTARVMTDGDGNFLRIDSVDPNPVSANLTYSTYNDYAEWDINLSSLLANVSAQDYNGQNLISNVRVAATSVTSENNYYTYSVRVTVHR